MAELKILCIHCADTHPGYRVDKGVLEQWHMGPCDIWKDGKIVGVKYLGDMYPDRDHLPNELIDQRHIRELHGRGWDRLGYSDLIHRNGDIENLTQYDDDDYISSDEITWGCSGINSKTRHVCLEGGKNTQNESGVFLFHEIFTDAQFTTLAGYMNQFLKDHKGDKIAGHYMFTDKKTCPNFTIGTFLENAGIDLKHLYSL